MTLYWLPSAPDGNIISSLCSGSDNDPYHACEFYVNGLCAIKIGSFSSNDQFENKPLEKVHQELLLNSNNQEAACAANMLAASLPVASGSQLLFSKGHVEAKGFIRNFGQIRVSDAYYTFA